MLMLDEVGVRLWNDEREERFFDHVVLSLGGNDFCLPVKASVKLRIVPPEIPELFINLSNEKEKRKLEKVRGRNWKS